MHKWITDIQIKRHGTHPFKSHIYSVSHKMDAHKWKQVPAIHLSAPNATLRLSGTVGPKHKSRWLRQWKVYYCIFCADILSELHKSQVDKSTFVKVFNLCWPGRAPDHSYSLLLCLKTSKSTPVYSGQLQQLKFDVTLSDCVVSWMITLVFAHFTIAR